MVPVPVSWGLGCGWWDTCTAGSTPSQRAAVWSNTHPVNALTMHGPQSTHTHTHRHTTGNKGRSRQAVAPPGACVVPCGGCVMQPPAGSKQRAAAPAAPAAVSFVCRCNASLSAYTHAHTSTKHTAAGAWGVKGGPPVESPVQPPRGCMVGLGHPGVALTPPRGDACQGMRGLSDSQGCMGDNLRAAVAGGAASHVGMCAAAAAVVVVHGGGPAVLWPPPPLYTAWRCLTQRLTGSWDGLTGRRLRALAHRAENCGGVRRAHPSTEDIVWLRLCTRAAAHTAVCGGPGACCVT